MQSHRKVFLFVIYSVSLFVLISVAAILFQFQWAPFKRVNLVSDVLTDSSYSAVVDTATIIDTVIQVNDKPNENFALYNQPHLITNFSADTSRPSLQRFL